MLKVLLKYLMLYLLIQLNVWSWPMLCLMLMHMEVHGWWYCLQFSYVDVLLLRCSVFFYIVLPLYRIALINSVLP